MISAVRFILHLKAYCQDTTQIPVTFFTDNKGLLTRIQQRRTFDNPYPTTTTAPDWNLIEPLYESLCKAKIVSTFAHVKGHQDDDEDYDTLSLPAQLNVDADHLAGNIRYSHPHYESRTVSLTTVTRVHPHIGNTTVTSHFRYHICYAASLPSYVAHRAKLHNWSDATLALLDIQLSQSFSKYNPLLQTFLFKWRHLVPPTKSQKAKWYRTSPNCPHRHSEDTMHHIYRCTALESQKWRSRMLTDVRIPTTLITPWSAFLLMASRAFFDDTTLDPTEYPRPYQCTISRQNHLGWSTFLMGFWTPGWQHLHRSHLKRTNNLTNVNNEHSWAQDLLNSTNNCYPKINN